MEKIAPQTRFKPLKPFYIGASSFILTGTFLAVPLDWVRMALLATCAVIGIFFVYRFNDHVDQSATFSMNLIRFFQYRLNATMIVLYLLLVLPLSIVYLNPFSFVMLAIGGFLGILYSMTFKWRGRMFRVKHAFVLKNLSIGFSWGLLVPIGAGTFDNWFVQAVFVIAAVQAFVGSAVRDIPDLEKDRNDRVYSMPVMLGINRTLLILHLINFGSLALFFLYPENFNELFLPLTGTVLWRMLGLIKVQVDTSQVRWTHKLNLYTKVVTFLLVVLSRLLW